MPCPYLNSRITYHASQPIVARIWYDKVMDPGKHELFIVFGGGCFGTHHVRHIEKGRKRGRISPEARVIMVDRNAHAPALDLPEVAENPCLTFVQSDWLDYMKRNWEGLPPDARGRPRARSTSSRV